MKLIVSFLILCSMLLGACDLNQNPDRSEMLLGEKLIQSKNYDSAVDLANAVSDAIIGISAETDNGTSVGAGVCVASNGVAITNSHVVGDSTNIVAHFSDGEMGNISVLWQDSIQDIAIIKVDRDMPFLPISDDDNLSVGQDVVAVGTPLSLILKHSYTKGIVSAINRTLRVETDYGESYMQNLVQHDASLNPGNSGGPLLNLKGEIVGINTLKISGGEGIGFAIPSKSFSSLVANMIASDFEYETPFLGAYGYDAEIANFNKLSSINKGFYVIDVLENSPLYGTNLKPGCTILKLNNAVVNNAADLKNELYKFRYGDQIILTYNDGQKEHFVKIKLAKNELR